MTTQDYAHLIR